MSEKLSRLKSKHTRKNRHASGLNENGSITAFFVCKEKRSLLFNAMNTCHTGKNITQKSCCELLRKADCTFTFSRIIIVKPQAYHVYYNGRFGCVQMIL